jgi:hypothetical protein
MDGALLKRPSALIPVAMSVAALATVAGYVAMFGTARQADEGAAAHLWQLLRAGQVPVVAFFAIKWLPAEPGRALPVSCPPNRRGACRDVPGLVVPVVAYVECLDLLRKPICCRAPSTC